MSFLTYFIIGIFVVIFFIIFINKALFFQIQSIEVTTNKLSDVQHLIIRGTNSNSEIYNSVAEKYTNILFSSSKEIKNHLQANFLEISNITVNRNLFKRKIYIFYSTREPKYIWCNSNIEGTTPDSEKCFLVDKSGILFKDNDQNENFMSIKNEYYQDLKLKNAIPSNVLYIVNNFSSILEQRSIDLKEIIIKNNSLIVFVLDILDAENNLKNTIDVRFSLEKDLGEQLEKSSSLINYLSNIDLEKIKYIDLRVKEKIYYR